MSLAGSGAPLAEYALPLAPAAAAEATRRCGNDDDNDDDDDDDDDDNNNNNAVLSFARHDSTQQELRHAENRIHLFYRNDAAVKSIKRLMDHQV